MKFLIQDTVNEKAAAKSVSPYFAEHQIYLDRKLQAVQMELSKILGPFWQTKDHN